MSECRRAVPQKDNRGIVLISSCLLLSIFLLYSNAVAMRTVNQQMTADRLRERFQATDMAQAAVTQLRADLSSFLTEEIGQLVYSGDAALALNWLDELGKGTEVPIFDLPLSDVNKDGQLTSADADGVRDGTVGNPRCLSSSVTVGAQTQTGLPMVKQGAVCAAVGTPTDAPRAWISSITNVGEDMNQNGQLDPGEDTNLNGVLDPPGTTTPRRVVIEAEAQSGGTVKRIRATYQVELGMSPIFRYAYFINNYGWFETAPGSWIEVDGEVRSNGDLKFGNGDFAIAGDLYASKNQDLINPTTGAAADGTIAGDPGQYSSQYDYWNWRAPGLWPSGQAPRSRPTRKLVFPDQPSVKGGPNPKILPQEYGWDSDYPTEANPDQRRYEGKPVHPIPYLSDLEFYKSLATQRKGTIKYTDVKTGKPEKVDAVYAGPDGQLGTADDKDPLVLIGTEQDPIKLDGPVVIPGDVIIKGKVQGRGVLYVGRNTHVVGDINYADGPSWPKVERNKDTGQIYDDTNYQSLGVVCNDGTFKPGNSANCGGI